MGRQMKVGGGLGCALLGILLAGCQAGSADKACPLAAQSRMVELKLYFGRDIPGGGVVNDAEWRRFAADVLTPAFPEGFTVFDATGQWRNPQSGDVVREPSYVVERLGPVDGAAVEGAMAAYRAQFHQVAVGRVTMEVCAGF